MVPEPTPDASLQSTSVEPLDDPERLARLRAQSHEVYAAIGEFAVKFEQVCHAMQALVGVILQRAGLTKQSLSDALLAGVTAEPLRQVLAAVMAEETSDPNDRRIVSALLKRIQDLTVNRNDIIHATWFVGWADSDGSDFATVSSMKLHRSKTGAAPKWTQANLASFAGLTKEAEDLQAMIQDICVSYLLGDPISATLRLDASGSLQRCARHEGISGAS